MKKFISIFMVLTLIVCFAGCKQRKGTYKENSNYPLVQVNILYDKYGNIIQQTLHNEETGEYFLKEFSYTYNNGQWVCTDQRLILLSAHNNNTTKDTIQNTTLRILSIKELNTKPVVLIDNEQVRVSIINFLDTEHWYRFAYELKIENKSNKVLSFYIDDASIMGINCSPLFYVDHVDAKHSAFFTLGWDHDALERNYIPYIDNVKFTIKVYDNIDWSTPAFAGERVLIKHNS